MLRWIHASTGPPTSASISAAGRASIVEVLSETNAQIEYLDDAMNAVGAGYFERAAEEASLRRHSGTSEDSLGRGD